MKKCPVCEKTFEDSMRFCQTDGAPLVDVAVEAPDDPYKTIVAPPDEPLTPDPVPDDPFKTMVVGSPEIPAPEGSGDLLDMPQADPLKTMYVSEDEIRQEMAADEPGDGPIFDVPQAEPEPPAPEPPAFSEPSLSPPAFGDMAPPPSPFSTADPEPLPEPESSASEASDPSEDPTLLGTPSPIPSPFSDSASQPYEPPPLEPESYSPSAQAGEPEPFPQYREPEPLPQYQEPANPFDQASQTPQQMEWAPPPAPEASWQNQPVGQDTPFQPPPAGTGSVNQVLPIISLVLGIVSLCCYISPVTGLAALITGFLGMKNANNDPANYGGKGLAIAGLIMGGIMFLVGVGYYIIVILIYAGIIGGAMLNNF